MLGYLLPCEPTRGDMGHYIRRRERARTHERDDGAAGFAQARVRHRDHGGFSNKWVRVEDVLDFLGADIFAAADDQVLLATRDDDGTPCVEPPEIAGQEETIGVEGFGVAVEIAITEEQFGTADSDLAFPVGDRLPFCVKQFYVIADNQAIRLGGDRDLVRLDGAK